MSRTYRRKNVKRNFYYDRNLVEINGEYFAGSNYGYIWRVYNSKKELIADRKKYHTDNYDPTTPDKWFRRVYGHKHDRAKVRACLRKELYAINKGNVIFPKQRDIAWEWY